MNDNNVNISYGENGNSAYSFIVNCDADGFFASSNGGFYHQLQFNAEEGRDYLYVTLNQGRIKVLESGERIFIEKKQIDSFDFDEEGIDNLISKLEIIKKVIK